MKPWIFKSLVLLLPFSITAEEKTAPIYDDQFSFCFMGNYFLIEKAMTIAEAHGYPYVKILSYELDTEQGRLSFSGTGEYPEGERFESLDDEGKLEVVCFHENTNNCFCICLTDFADEEDD